VPLESACDQPAVNRIVVSDQNVQIL
jgi:hypothetical protein